MEFISIRNLEKNYGQNNIFKNINFDIKKGEFITLLGPSGCGKSTLLRCIAGLNEIDSGAIFVSGKDISKDSPKDRGIGMVFQNYALFPNMNVYDNIAFGLSIKKVSKAEIDERVREMLELVQLEGKEKYFPSELSGGQKQRVAIARSIIMKPEILLLDEPLSALDAKVRKTLREEIRRIQRMLGITTIFVTHDQEEALTVSDRIFIMNKGNIVQNGSPEEVYTSPNNLFLAKFIGNYNIFDKNQIKKIFPEIKDEMVAIRPEAIYVREEERNYNFEKFICKKAEIKNIIILGNVIRYSVDILGESLVVDLLNRGEYKLYNIGSTVELMFLKNEIKKLN